jgi:hypothetical protein
MDNYFDVTAAASIATEVANLEKTASSYTYRMIAALINAQFAMDYDWCQVYTITNNVRKNTALKKDFRMAAIPMIFEYMDGYDTITIIKFSSDLQETLCETVSDTTTKSILYLPNVVLYGDSDLETFQDEYMLNETKRMFSVVFTQEQDVIDVIFKNKKPLGLGGDSY